MKTNELLANVKVASPCSARWGHMVGDDRARFCAQCQKHVYNLSSLTADEAAALIREREGSLCARFYQRADGTVLTADCPVGAGQVWARFRRLLGAAAALMLLGVTVPLIAKSPSRDELPRARAKVYRAWDDAIVTIKTWLGHPPARTMVMGEICVVPPPGNAPANPPAKSSCSN
jgi:hypothetical protein